ncbi:MAG: hypothetical protein H7320_08070 [Ferruginibacter sp.]|nr:hypothetical protein [Ferruginibacter sp.]
MKIYFSILSIAFSLSAFCQFQWTQINVPHPNKSAFKEIDIPDANSVWAVFSRAIGIDSFAVSPNAGATWTVGTIAAAGTSCNISNLMPLSATVCYATINNYGNSKQGIYKTTDGGLSWQQIGIGNIYTSAGSFPDFTYFWNANQGVTLGDNDAATGNFEIYTTSDGGISWLRVPVANLPLAGTTPYGLTNGYKVVGKRIWFFGRDNNTNRIYRSDNFGMNWVAYSVPFSLPELFTFTDTLHGYGIATVAGVKMLYTSTDGGATWSSGIPYTGHQTNVYNLTNVPGTSIIATASNGGTAYSTDNGSTWIPLDSADHTFSMKFFSPSVGWSSQYRVNATDPGGIFKLNAVLPVKFTSFTSSQNAQIINTIAGNGLVGDGGPATNAALKSPWHVGTDAAGNVYIADSYLNRIRKIDAFTGIISNFAGNEVAGFSGDGGLATNASLNYPSDIFIAPSGNFYIVDGGNYRIRKVDAATGIITTIAGTGIKGLDGDSGPALAAKIAPWRLCVDADENIYFTGGYYVIRKIDGATGSISTIAGTGIVGDYGTSGDGGPAVLANVYSQMGICIDAKKNIYISDLGIPRIRKIDATTGIINTIAGNGSSFADNILAINSKFNGTIRSVSVDSVGNIYIGTKVYCRKIDAVTGIISSVIGSGAIQTSGFFGDGGPATLAKTDASGGMYVNRQGDIFIADFNNRRVRKVPAATGIINTIGGNGGLGLFNGDNIFATAACLNEPNNILIDTTSNIFIADKSNNRIRKINSSTGLISTIAGNGMAGFSADGTLASSSTITVSQIRMDLENNLYFNDGNNRIRKINAITNKITTVAGNGISGFSGDGTLATSASIQISDFCVDSHGFIFIANGSNYRVRVVDASTGIISTFGSGVSATTSNFGDGGPISAAKFHYPNGIFIDKNDNIFIADRSFGVVRKVDKITGIINTVAGNGTYGSTAVDGTIATAGSLGNISNIFVDTTGNLYLQEVAAIRKVEKTTGIITTIAGNKIAGFSGDGGIATNAQINPGGFTLDKTGDNLLIADVANNRIRKVSFNNIVLCPGTGNKSITSNISGAANKWEMNNGTGFVPIANNANFTGTNSASLQLINIPNEWTGYQLRCITDNKYSNVFTLQFIAQWIGVVDKTWSNITNWDCNIPDANTDVIISAGNNIVVDVNVTIKSLQLSAGATVTVAPGINFTILH